MFDFTTLVGFEWDRGNERKSLDKHAVTQAEAEQVFFNQPLVIKADARHSQSEPRIHALGKTNEGRRLHITFTVRADRTLLRVISARDMNRRERAIYAKTSP